jgi:hypothetical protein
MRLGTLEASGATQTQQVDFRHVDLPHATVHACVFWRKARLKDLLQLQNGAPDIVIATRASLLNIPVEMLRGRCHKAERTRRHGVCQIYRIRAQKTPHDTSSTCYRRTCLHQAPALGPAATGVAPHRYRLLFLL